MTSGRDPEERRIVLHEEALSVGKRPVERGSVSIATIVHERREQVDLDLDRESVEVVRVPVNRPVEVAPAPRQDGDTLIIPILEEELVVTKRLVLREELHVRKRTERRTERIAETLRSEEAVVTRHDGRTPDESQTNPPFREQE
ncbi:YsnF/AvaK domain-containing protein [Azospirillum thermophilum]|uniref:DUF2382 domain-containing protein n=1 Tax=Azospirillum thermophilum TaxID=2202148 RepID=A0A2S2CP40_9PROT|nr:YsnF/AvaK domain-containing protein [Azospirillum thermophilum]AWK86293.1 hypothetical protein DEW08_08590 [Azospirillum thermophilum]